MVKPVPQAEGAFPLPGYTYHDTYHAAGGGAFPLCAANPNPNPNQAEGPFPYALLTLTLTLTRRRGLSPMRWWRGRRRSATSSCLTRWAMLPSYHPPTRAEAQCYFELPDEVGHVT